VKKSKKNNGDTGDKENVTKGIKGKNNTGERSKLKNKGKNKKDYLIEDQLTKEGRAIFKPKGERIFSMSDDGKNFVLQIFRYERIKGYY